MLLFGFVAFLLAPKINVNSWLRIEDLVFLCVLPVLIWRHAPGRSPLPGFIKWYFAYLAFATLSALANFSNLGFFGIINVVRQVQYVIWFAVGAQMAALIPQKHFRRSMTIVGTIFIFWALGEAAGVIPKIGKFTGAVGRVTLNTSGPYEISVVVVFLMLFVRSRLVLLGLISVLLMTEARVTLGAAVVLYLIQFPRHGLIYGGPLVAILSAILIFDPDILAGSRFAVTLGPIEMWQAWNAQLAITPVIDDLSQYYYYGYETVWQQIGGITDVSFEIRTIRWALILKSLSNDWIHFLIGSGPGAWGAAVDGHFVRFLGEIGIIGTAIFAAFAAVSIFSPSSPSHYRSAMILLVLCSVFIDVMTSSKIMSFLWGIAGYTHVRNQIAQVLHNNHK